MKRIEDIAAAYPRVGTLLSPEAESVRGQLTSIGFTPCDGGDSGLNWLITDGSADTPAADVPILRLNGNISIYGLKQAIIALLAPKD